MANALLITGASGYIGRRLVAAARARGLQVVAAVRDPARAGGSTPVRRFDLACGDDLHALLEGISAVIHLAAILREESQPAGVAEDRNVSGSRRLIEAARRRGVRRFVFLSSQSAAAASPTRYGRSKWSIERLLDRPGEVSVRAGLVGGGPPRGLWGLLLRLTRRLPLLPVVAPRTPVYPIHVDDVCAGLLRLALAPEPPAAVVRLAAREPVAFADYVRLLALERTGRPVRILPIPGWVARLASRGLPSNLRERVAGLAALPDMPCGSLPEALPAAPGAFRPALHREGLRRRLLLEGRVLGRYTLGRSASRPALARYARAVLDAGDPQPLELPLALIVWPRLLGAFDGPGAGRRPRLSTRLNLATRIFEMTPVAAPRFHAYRPTPSGVAWLALAGTLLVEALWLPPRLIARAWRYFT
jgi:NADH dehydrogenase